MDHALLVAAEIVGKVVRELLRSLRNATDVAVTEDAPEASEEALLHTVDFDMLVDHELHDGLSHRELDRRARRCLSSRTEILRRHGFGRRAIKTHISNKSDLQALAHRRSTTDLIGIDRGLA